MQSFFEPVITHGARFFIRILAAFICSSVAVAILLLVPRSLRKTIIGVATFLGGAYYVVEFYTPAHGHPSVNFLSDHNDIVANFSLIFQAFALGLGVISLVQQHAKVVVRGTSGWAFSAALLVAFFSMVIFGLLNAYAPHGRILHTAVTNAEVFSFLFVGGLTNFGSAMFSMVAFFIASAAYRAFRIKTIESSLLMLSAMIVMLGSVSFGTWITHGLPEHGSPLSNLRIENVSQWIMIQVNSPAQRGILFGLGVGELAVALRIWLSLERGSYFEK